MLYLHIGTGKAGSTSIQSFLKHCRSELPYRQLETFGIGNSWKVAASSATERSRRYWVEMRNVLGTEEHQRLCSAFWTEVQSEVASLAPSDYVASSEYIYGQLRDDREAIARLQQNLVRIFGKVKIIVYFRNQIDYVKSVYSQLVNGPLKETRSFHQWIRNLDTLPINYGEQFQLWGEVYGCENIDAVVFDRRNLVNNSLIEDFCARTQIEYDEQRFAFHQPRANVSPSYNHIVALRCLNLLPLRKHHWRARRIINCIPALKEFPSKYDDLILSQVSQGNKWLNQNVFFDQPAKLPVID